jgi:Tfp pilus assembly protein PilX
MKNNFLIKERGVVLWITLVILVVLMVTAVGMIKSTDTAVLSSGNLSFKQSAVSSSDRGIQEARQWIIKKVSGAADPLSCGSLDSDCVAAGYSASLLQPGVDQTWNDFWTENIAKSRDMGTDAAGNRVRVWIQRMCENSGAWNATSNDCVTQVDQSSTDTSSKQAGKITLNGFTRIHFNILVKVDGPRNTSTLLQTVVQSDV